MTPAQIFQADAATGGMSPAGRQSAAGESGLDPFDRILGRVMVPSRTAIKPLDRTIENAAPCIRPVGLSGFRDVAEVKRLTAQLPEFLYFLCGQGLCLVWIKYDRFHGCGLFLPCWFDSEP